MLAGVNVERGAALGVLRDVRDDVRGGALSGGDALGALGAGFERGVISLR